MRQWIRRLASILPVLMVSSVVGAQVAEATIWQLADHPGGNLFSNSPYGIRADSLGGNPGPLFSVSDLPGTSVQLSWDGTLTADNIAAKAVITGTVVRNNDGTAFANTTWTVTYTLTELTASNGGFRASAGTGTMTCTDCPGGSGLATILGLLAKSKANTTPPEAFTFAPDGHRLSGDTTTWVGRGWLYDIDPITGKALKTSYKTNDWLVTGDPDTPPPPGQVPEPSALLLFALGLVGLTGLLWRRRTTL